MDCEERQRRGNLFVINNLKWYFCFLIFFKQIALRVEAAENLCQW